MKKAKKLKKDKTEKKLEYSLNADGQILGRFASKVAILLRGKNRADFLPYQYKPIKVIVKNLDKIKFSGKKLKTKEYHHHSGYPGGLKTVKLEKMFANDPSLVFKKAVYNMLPKNKLRKKMMRNLKLFNKDS